MTSSPPNLLSPLALPFDMDATLSSSSPEQQEQEQTLPNELLRHIFLYLDPHTLYTSVRGLNAHWQRAVEHDLLHDLFRTRTWRVGLRVSRKPRLPSEAHEGSLSPPHQQQQHDPPASASIEIGEEEAAESAEQLKCRMARQEAEMREVLGTPHITEDDVLSLANTHAALNRRMAAASSRRSRADAFSASRMRMRKPNRPIVHVVPLVFDAYRPGSTSLAFSTGDEWHALFDGLDIEHGSRLELDFGLCWRFPGDGQDPDCERKRDCHMAGGSVLIDEEEGDDEQELLEKYWGTPDVENGWLSRFYCVRCPITPSPQVLARALPPALEISLH
ncbi:hypothetical protein K437DRAFT_171738 [Tilletiaria anomala UBC 951]|uniref:F-box domain-containing protein n=1 Tax=Tilletiaria anomala (strain ATCC 24038 / CBS 436.72 / UBC 951) TaxID=1037660 RepID=A0A066VS17_TILAU|nr:uncharacterized protein K437DRAFT_171738 [Tilletiaria anomala UBC 951]KDN41599.1 hypothetical protein K437DRAFT_171738 [Tilletiaria anomala UBC 951]